MSRKTLILSEEFTFPAIRKGYKSEESGFIHKVKNTKQNYVEIYFPELRRPITEQQRTKSGALSKSKSQSLDNLTHFRKKTNIVDYKLLSEGENSSNVQLQFLPDLPAFSQRHLNITHSKTMHTVIESRREKTHLDVTSSQYKTDETSQSTCNNTVFPKLPQSRVSQLHRAKSNLLSTHNIRMTKLPCQEGNRLNRLALARKWKTNCNCLRCCIMFQQFKDKDTQAYDMWGSYPCQNLQLDGVTTTATTSSLKQDS